MIKEIGQRIRKIRESQDLKQEDMAKSLDLTAGAYAKIERGETDPSITRLYQVAKILKVDINSLLSDKPLSKEIPISRAEINNLHLSLDSLNKQLQKLGTEIASLKKSPVKKK